jgi:hypothetical protein
MKIEVLICNISENKIFAHDSGFRCFDSKNALLLLNNFYKLQQPQSFNKGLLEFRGRFSTLIDESNFLNCSVSSLEGSFIDINDGISLVFSKIYILLKFRESILFLKDHPKIIFF